MSVNRIVVVLNAGLRTGCLLLLLANQAPPLLAHMQVLFAVPIIVIGAAPVALITAIWVISFGLSFTIAPAMLLAAVPALSVGMAAILEARTGRRDLLIVPWARGHAAVVRPLLLCTAILALSTILLRKPSVGAALVWAVTYGVLWARMPAAGWRITRSLVASLSVSLITTILGLFAAEIFVRYFLPEPPLLVNRGMYMHHPVTGFSLNPGFEGEMAYVDAPESHGTFPVKISAQGLRDRAYGPKRPDEFRIVLLGDSFAMGWSLPLEQSFGKVLERRLGEAGLPYTVSVINGGVGSFGPWQERVFLHERCMPLEPDLVLHQIFTPNDIENTLWQTDEVLQAYNVGATQAYMRFRESMRYPNNIEWACHDASALYRLTLRSLGRQDLAAAILLQFRCLPQRTHMVLPPSAPREYNPEFMLRQWYPMLQKGWTMLQEDILAVREDCRNAGIPYVAFDVPELVSVADGPWVNATQVLGEALYERGKDVRMTEEFFARNNIPYLTLYDALRAAQTPQEPLYFIYDGHLNRAGARLAGETLANQLLEKGLLPAPRPE